MTFPGAPGVVLGHNARIAWGATNVDPDVQDLFVDPAGPEATRTPTSSPASRCRSSIRHETIKVAGGDAGRDGRPDDPRTARSSTTSTPASRTRRCWPSAGRRRPTTSDGTFEAFFQLDTATTFEEFHDGVRRLRRPVAELRLRRRRGPHRLRPARAGSRSGPTPGRPRRPASDPGSDGKHEWTGHDPVRRTCRGSSTRPSGMIVTREQRRGRRAVPVLHRPGVGPRLPGEADHRPAQTAAASGGVSTGIPADRAIQTDTAPRGRATSCVELTDVTPADPATARSSRSGSSAGEARLPRRIARLRGLHGVRVPRCSATSFDDELGPLAREYVGSSASLAGARSRSSTSRTRRGGTTSGRPSPGDARRHRSAAAHRRGRRGAAGRLRRPGELDLGPRAPGHVRGGDARVVRDRAARVVLQRRPVRGAGRRRGGRTTSTTGRRGPTRTRTTRLTPARDRPASSTSRTCRRTG